MDLFLFQAPKDDEPQAAPVLSMESLSIQQLSQVELDLDFKVIEKEDGGHQHSCVESLNDMLSFSFDL